MSVATAGNGHATRAEHESLRTVVEAMREEQLRQRETLKFIEQQARFTGQALELLLAERGLDLPEEPQDD